MAKTVYFCVRSNLEIWDGKKIEWKVQDVFSACNENETSEEFNFQSSRWRLALDKTMLKGTERIRILLKEIVGDPFVDFMSRVFIVDKNRTPQFLTEQLCNYTGDWYSDCVWWMDAKDFQEREHILSTGGVVSFVCFLFWKTSSEDREKKPVQTSIYAKAEGSVETLILDFHRLLDESTLSDVTLKCGDHTIPAHRLILSARSEVFAAMLRNDMTEKRSGVIEISDMDPPILDQLLQFIYSCKLPDMTMDTTPQLYEAADKYGLESLKKICSSFMMENLTEGNACCIIHLADSHSDEDLKTCVVFFIKETMLFHKDNVWLKFCEDHPKLAIEVLNRICKSLSCFV